MITKQAQPVPSDTLIICKLFIISKCSYKLQWITKQAQPVPSITPSILEAVPSGVPSLRNVAASYPYMHDGRFNTLEEVIDHYRTGVVQSPTLAPELREPLFIDNKQKAQLIAFLNTLTDDEFLYDIRFRNWVR